MNTGVGYHFLLQEIFPTQGSNLCLLDWQADSLPPSHLGSLHLENHCYLTKLTLFSLITLSSYPLTILK